MRHELTTEQGREAAFDELNIGFVNALLAQGIELVDNTIAVLSVSGARLEVHDDTCKILFGSGIDFYSQRSKFGALSKNSISYGSCGSFNDQDMASVGRTLNAAAILTNWRNATAVLEDYCLKYRNLCADIDAVCNQANEEEK